MVSNLGETAEEPSLHARRLAGKLNTVQVKEDDSLDQGGSSRIEAKRANLKQIEDLVDWTRG